ncbi:hypothetical protein Dimus_013774 [Dionaea muscipula]
MSSAVIGEHGGPRPPSPPEHVVNVGTRAKGQGVSSDFYGFSQLPPSPALRPPPSSPTQHRTIGTSARLVGVDRPSQTRSFAARCTTQPHQRSDLSSPRSSAGHQPGRHCEDVARALERRRLSAGRRCHRSDVLLSGPGHSIAASQRHCVIGLSRF